MDDKLKKLEDTSETSSQIASSWNTAHETLLAAIGDKCNCMRWMHSQSQIYFDRWNFWLTIPNVAVTALSGSASIGITSLFSGERQMVAGLVIGLMMLSSGVLTSINQYMKTSQFSESHRISAIAYGKLHRIISSELTLRRDQRTNAHSFLEIIRSEQDRLEESSPAILNHIIDKFNEKIKDNPELERPEIAGTLDHVQVNISQRDTGPSRGLSSPKTYARLPTTGQS